MIGLDTNVLVRFLTRDDPAQAEASYRLITERCSEDEPGFINVVSLCELAWVLQTRHRYRREDVWEALALFEQGGADFADALIGIINRRHGCIGNATFDRKAAGLDDFFPV